MGAKNPIVIVIYVYILFDLYKVYDRNYINGVTIILWFQYLPVINIRMSI